MRGVVWNARYYDPKKPDIKQMTPAEAIEYGATREGTHIINEEETRFMEAKNAFQYIAHRRGVEYFENGSDGLFNAFGKADLAEETARAAASNAIMWKGVLSFAKEDAERLGYTNVQAFRELLCRQLPAVAKEHGISPENLVWSAAYHPVDKKGNDHHPHVHVYMYSTDEREGRRSPEQTKRAFEKARSLFTNDAFSEDMQILKEDQTRSREQLKIAITKFTATDHPELLEEFINLGKILPTKGREGSYKYLPYDTKFAVDALFQKITASPGIDRVFDQYISAHRHMVEMYNSSDAAVDKRMDEFMKHTLHPTAKNDRRDFHNAIIRTARAIVNTPVAETAVDALAPLSTVHRDSGWSDLSSAAQWELKQYVGVSAFVAVKQSSQDKFMRRWLNSLYSEYGADLSSMLKAAQKDTWRSITSQVRSSVHEDESLKHALRNECRIYLSPSEQAASQGVFENGQELILPSYITEGTQDAVVADVHQVLHGVSNATDATIEGVTEKYYAEGVRLRVRRWFDDDRVKPIFEELERQTHAVLHFANNSPEDLLSAANSTVIDAMRIIGDNDPAVKEEWQLMMKRIALTRDASFMDTLTNEAFLKAYKLGVSEQCRQFYKNLPNKENSVRWLMGKIAFKANFQDLSPDIQQHILSLLPITPHDARCEELLLNTAIITIKEQQIENLLDLSEQQKSYLQNAVHLFGDFEELNEQEAFVTTLEPVVQSAIIKAPALQDADPDMLRRVLWRSAYEENRQKQFKVWRNDPKICATFENMARQVTLTDLPEELSPEMQKNISFFTPDETWFDKKGYKQWEKDVLAQIERIHIDTFFDSDLAQNGIMLFEEDLHAVRYRINDACPREICAKADWVLRNIMHEACRTAPSVAQEWNDILQQGDDYKYNPTLKKLTDAVLQKTYQLGVSNQFKAFYKGLNDENQQAFEELSKSLPLDAEFSNLSVTTQQKIYSLLPQIPRDNECEKRLLNTAVITIKEQRIENMLALSKQQQSYLQNMVRLCGDFEELNKQKAFVRALEPVVRSAINKSPALQDADPDMLRRVLWRSAYEENRQKQFESWRSDPKIREAFENMAQQITLTDLPKKLTPKLRQQVSSFTPAATQFDKKGREQWEKDVLAQIIRTRVTMLIKQEPQLKTMISELLSDKKIKRECMACKYTELSDNTLSRLEAVSEQVSSPELMAYAKKHPEAISKAVFHEVKNAAWRQHQMQMGICQVITTMMRSAKIAEQQNQQQLPRRSLAKAKKKSQKQKQEQQHSQRERDPYMQP